MCLALKNIYKVMYIICFKHFTTHKPGEDPAESLNSKIQLKSTVAKALYVRTGFGPVRCQIVFCSLGFQGESNLQKIVDLQN